MTTKLTAPDHGAATFVAWVFPTALAVDAAELRIKRLQEQHRLTVRESATVMWLVGEKQAKIVRHFSTGHAVGKGAVWGGIVGTILGGPVGGAAVGAAVAGAAPRLRRAHLPADVLASVRDEMRPGRSALLVLAAEKPADADIDAVSGQETGVTVLRAELA
jgi:uncharacterized membrane protein